jgi:hypothetical protein
VSAKEIGGAHEFRLPGEHPSTSFVLAPLEVTYFPK